MSTIGLIMLNTCAVTALAKIVMDPVDLISIQAQCIMAPGTMPTTPALASMLPTLA